MQLLSSTINACIEGKGRMRTRNCAVGKKSKSQAKPPRIDLAATTVYGGGKGRNDDPGWKESASLFDSEQIKEHISKYWSYTTFDGEKV